MLWTIELLGELDDAREDVEVEEEVLPMTAAAGTALPQMVFSFPRVPATCAQGPTRASREGGGKDDLGIRFAVASVLDLNVGSIFVIEAFLVVETDAVAVV